MPSQELSEPTYHVRALQRGLSILVAFTAGSPQLSLQELHQRLELNKATLLRLLDVLQEMDFVNYDKATAKYHLGIRAFEVGSAYLSNLPIEQLAHPYLCSLTDFTGQTANLGVLNGYEVVHVATVQPERPLYFHTRVGLRDGLHCTALGKTLAAFMDAERLEDYLAHAYLTRWTPATHTTIATLRSELTMIRQIGIAEDKEERAIGLRCIATPIRDATGQVVAAISISGPAAEFTEASLPAFKEAILKTAGQISERLGYMETIVIRRKAAIHTQENGSVPI